MYQVMLFNMVVTLMLLLQTPQILSQQLLQVGLVSKGINWRGNWDANTTYQLGDTVKHLSNSYIGVATAGSTIKILRLILMEIIGISW